MTPEIQNVIILLPQVISRIYYIIGLSEVNECRERATINTPIVCRLLVVYSMLVYIQFLALCDL